MFIFCVILRQIICYNMQHLADSVGVETGSEVEVKLAAAFCHSSSVREKKMLITALASLCSLGITKQPQERGTAPIYNSGPSWMNLNYWGA